MLTVLLSTIPRDGVLLEQSDIERTVNPSALAEMGL